MLRLATAAMGTRFEIVLPPIPGLPEADLRAAGEAALDEIRFWHTRLSRFEPDSLVSHIARTGGRAPIPLDEPTWCLFRDALHVAAASGGAFDVGVAPAMARRGFGRSAVMPAGSDARPRGTRRATLHLDEAARTLTILGPSVALDLGGIGKGHALECAGAVLRHAGVTSAFLHGGTSSGIAIGRPPDDRGWRVAFGGEAPGVIACLADRAFSVSNTHGRVNAAGRGHIIVDRDRGRARSRGAEPTWVAVTGPSARLADAWTTALLAMGRTERAPACGYDVLWGPA
jgi:thiamine biosynthesis lipoprotein